MSLYGEWGVVDSVGDNWMNSGIIGWGSWIWIWRGDGDEVDT